MGLETLLRGIVSRPLPQAATDTQRQSVRLNRYQEIVVLPSIRKQHALVDEGSYFLANNAGTGVASAAAPTAYSDTAPLMTIYNASSPTDPSAKKIYLDWVRMVETAAGTAGTGIRLQFKLDNRNNYASGGTKLTIMSPSDLSPASGAVAYAFPVAAATSVNAKVVVPDLLTVVGATAPLAVSSLAEVNFGGVEKNTIHIVSTTTALAIAQAPPIIIAPGWCLTINFIITAQSAASSWEPQAGWWER